MSTDTEVTGADPEASAEPVRATGLERALLVVGGVLLVAAVVTWFLPIVGVDPGRGVDFVDESTVFTAWELAGMGEAGHAAGAIASSVTLALLGVVALLIGRQPLEYHTSPTGRTGVRVGGFLLTRRTLAYLVGVLAVGVILWNFGGGGLSFDARPRRDPDLRFDWGFAWELTPDFLRAVWVTVQGTLGGFAFAAVFGLFLALGRRARLKIVAWPVAFLIEFIRSTPILLQLFFWFFALPGLGFLPEFMRVLNPLTALIVALGVHYGTYCSEAYRAGINSVPKGQWEASTAMNLSSTDTWAQVILPQAIPNVLPALGNFLIAAFKDAPLAFSINVTGMMYFATTTVRRTFASVEVYTMLGIGFLLVSLPSAYLLRRLERRIGYERTE